MRARRPEMTEAPTFDSYYGRPILKEPAWRQPDVPLYLLLGGIAGSSATMAGLAALTGRDELAQATRLVASGSSIASVGALVHDLGRPERFLYMLRVFKPTSPLSVGSWILAPFSALAGAAAGSSLTGRFPRIGRLAGGASSVFGPAMCTYTAVLLADTAIPAWHEAYRELPLVFGGSALASGAGAALAAVPRAQTGPARRVGLLGAAAELGASRRLEQAHGVVSEPYRTGRAGRLLETSRVLTVTGGCLSLLSRRSRVIAAAAGVAYLAAGACTRFGIYAAGVESARNPKYVVLPQRERLGSTARSEAPLR